MNRRLGSWCSVALVTLVFASCAAEQKKQSPAGSSQATPLSASSVPRVASFLVIVDVSESMVDKYEGHVMFDLAKQTISRLNQTLPEWNVRAGLVAFGTGNCLGAGDTHDLYGMTAYKRADLDAAIAKLTCAAGTTPMDDGLRRAQEKLDGSTGDVAVLLVSDGWVKGEKPLAAARKLKEAFGARLCLYPLQIGKTERGTAVMTDLAKAGVCGFAKNADDLASGNAMAEYVTKVFLEPVPAPPK